MYKSMATKKRGLGQGIDSLIPNKVNANKETETVKVNAGSEKNETDGIFVNINKVEPNREQPRKNFDEDSLVDLSESIKQVGVLQPLLVLDKKDYYEIIAGERRWRAAKLAGLKEVPVRSNESYRSGSCRNFISRKYTERKLKPIRGSVCI